MTNPNGWPNADEPGVPMTEGAHVLRHRASGAEIVALWSGYDWLDATCDFGAAHAADCYDYLGPCLTPAEVAAREAAARREGIEAAAREVDCGCAARPDVLARLAESGRKRASYLCSYGDACCALQAMEIRALKGDKT